MNTNWDQLEKLFAAGRFEDLNAAQQTWVIQELGSAEGFDSLREIQTSLRVSPHRISRDEPPIPNPKIVAALAAKRKSKTTFLGYPIPLGQVAAIALLCFALGYLLPSNTANDGHSDLVAHNTTTIWDTLVQQAEVVVYDTIQRTITVNEASKKTPFSQTGKTVLVTQRKGMRTLEPSQIGDAALLADTSAYPIFHNEAPQRDLPTTRELDHFIQEIREF